MKLFKRLTNSPSNNGMIPSKLEPETKISDKDYKAGKREIAPVEVDGIITKRKIFGVSMKGWFLDE